MRFSSFVRFVLAAARIRVGAADDGSTAYAPRDMAVVVENDT